VYSSASSVRAPRSSTRDWRLSSIDDVGEGNKGFPHRRTRTSEEARHSLSCVPLPVEDVFHLTVYNIFYKNLTHEESAKVPELWKSSATWLCVRTCVRHGVDMGRLGLDRDASLCSVIPIKKRATSSRL
jgi:hypothetical protein